MSENLTNKVRDGMIRHIFKEPKHIMNLMQDLKQDVFGSDELPFEAESIRKFDLDSDFFNRKLKNDISFIATDADGKDKYMILLEHQSTNNINMPARFFAYYNQLFSLYLVQNKNNIEWHSNKPVELPSPDDVKFILVYDGKEPFKKDFKPFYKGQEITVKDIKFDNLVNKDKSSMLAGYSYFIYKRDTKLDELLKNGIEREVAKTQAFNYAKEETKKAGYLIEILGKEEFEMVMADVGRLFDYAEDLKYEGELIGIEKGIEKGTIESIKKLIINTDMKFQNIAKAFEVDMETIKDAYTQIIANISDIGERATFMEKRPSDFEANTVSSPSLFKK